MKSKRSKHILWFGIILIFTVGISVFTRPNLKGIKKEIVENNGDSVKAPMRSEYDSLCELENKKNKYFPSKNVNYAKLTKNNFWKRTKTLEANELAELLEFLNDSANYIWGELGTPKVHYYLTYYDKNSKCIGLTTIDLRGMAYSYPSISRMKWGMLKGMSELDKLIAKY